MITKTNIELTFSQVPTLSPVRVETSLTVGAVLAALGDGTEWSAVGDARTLPLSADFADKSLDTVRIEFHADKSYTVGVDCAACAD